MNFLEIVGVIAIVVVVLGAVCIFVLKLLADAMSDA